MRTIFYIALSILFLLLCHNATGQEFPMLHYTAEDGLPSNTIYETYKDRKGFLWIATDKGIARYNGIKFETFTTTNGLADNEVFFFREDYEGRLWMATYNGELCYYKNDTFHTALNTPFLRTLYKSPHITFLSLESDSSVTVSFFNETKFINIKKNHGTTYNADSLIDWKYLSSLFYKKKLNNGSFYILTIHGSRILDSAGRVTIKEDNLNSDSTNIISYRFCKEQEFFFDKKYIYDSSLTSIRQFPKDFKENNALYVLKIRRLHNNFFITTNNGLFINDTIQILKDQKISNVELDNSGKYWLSTLENGIFIVHSNLNNIVYKNAYTGQVLFAKKDNNTLYYANSEADIHSISGNSLKCLFTIGKENKRRLLKYYLVPAAYINDDFKYYYLYNRKIYFLDDVRKSRLTIKSREFAMPAPKAIFESDNVLYLRLSGNIFKIYSKSLAINKPIEATKIEMGKKGDRIFGMGVDNDKHIWYSTIDEIYKITNEQPVLQTQFKRTSFKSFIFHDKYIIGITYNNKLIVCDSPGSTAKVVDSFFNEHCVLNKLYSLDKNHVMVSTNNLYRLITINSTHKGKEFSIRTIENPFIPLQPEEIATIDSSCYFFNNGTITKMDINSILATSAPPQMFFNYLKTTKYVHAVDSIVTIPYSESKNITIKLSTLAFTDKIISRIYSISKDESDNWQAIDGEAINLFNPSYGVYKIKVMAKSTSSDYGKPIEFTLLITRPYWATWWFNTMVVIVIIIIVVITIQYRIRRELYKKEKEHLVEIKYLKSEYKALNSLMNPHFIFNTLNNVQGLINRDEKLAANQYLRVFANLVRQNMHNVSKELIPLHDEIELIVNYLKLEKLRFKHKLNYSINIEDEADISDILVPPLLVQPLVENSIKHGLLPRKAVDNFIHVDIYENGNELIIAVKDNGIGINASQEKADKLHESFGLENIRKRIEQLSIIQGKKLSLTFTETTDEAGTVWTVATIVIPHS